MNKKVSIILKAVITLIVVIIIIHLGIKFLLPLILRVHSTGAF